MKYIKSLLESGKSATECAQDLLKEAKQSGDKEAYDKFFDSKLAKYKVKSPSELSDEDKKKFYSEIENEWESDDEMNEAFDDDKAGNLLYKIGKEEGKYDLYYDIESSLIGGPNVKGITKILKNYEVYDEYKKYLK